MEQHGLQYSVEAVLPKDIELRWGELAPLLQKWLNSAFGEYILTDIRRLLEAGDFHAWLVRGNGKAVGVCVTAITEFPQKKILQIVGVAGDKLDEWLELLAEIEDWAKLNGCVRITGCGRIGWERVLAKRGFYRQYSVIGKDL